VLVGNEEDLQKGLGVAGAGSGLALEARFQRVLRHDRSRGGEIPERFKVVATTLREVHSTNRHSWSAVAWINGKTVRRAGGELDVYDRVGGGDGFAAGFFYGLLAGESHLDAVKLGWAHGALLTTFPGDTTMATLDQVKVPSPRAARPAFNVKEKRWHRI
jgi:2-dehydro-3-deoxygluconokinase